MAAFICMLWGQPPMESQSIQSRACCISWRTSWNHRMFNNPPLCQICALVCVKCVPSQWGFPEEVKCTTTMTFSVKHRNMLSHVLCLGTTYIETAAKKKRVIQELGFTVGHCKNNKGRTCDSRVKVWAACVQGSSLRDTLFPHVSFSLLAPFCFQNPIWLFLLSHTF